MAGLLFRLEGGETKRYDAYRSETPSLRLELKRHDGSITAQRASDATAGVGAAAGAVA